MPDKGWLQQSISSQLGAVHVARPGMEASERLGVYESPTSAIACRCRKLPQATARFDTNHRARRWHSFLEASGLRPARWADWPMDRCVYSIQHTVHSIQCSTQFQLEGGSIEGGSLEGGSLVGGSLEGGSFEPGSLEGGGSAFTDCLFMCKGGPFPLQVGRGEFGLYSLSVDQ